jgi:uncharacterized Fe-S cluster-containing radical SAM superfamily protein
MSSKVQRIFFLQLPRLDNDSRGIGENLPMAAFYLSQRLEREKKDRYETRFLTAEEEDLCDHELSKRIVGQRPDVIAATLYLWNIERTLHVLRHIKKHLPHVRIIVGGPEVAPRHPFLFRSRVPDVAVAGEGEPVFPLALEALRRGVQPDLNRVAWKTDGSYLWGSQPVRALALGPSLPPPEHRGWKPDSHGMAYLETSRGCPLRCSYCRYGHFRHPTFLGAPETKRRVQILMDRGAREFRFVDPVFNANPEFGEILKALRDVNRSRNATFFAEIQADLLSPDEIALLAEARFTEVEAGVQSLDPSVLSRIHRPVRFEPLEKNLRLLIRQGVRVTIDLMYGLPSQSSEEVEASLRWAWNFRRVNVQCFQTLLLPGTQLRERRRLWKISADRLPPYGVISTSTLSPADVRDIETLIHNQSPTDCMTRRFVGKCLPDLFKERILLPAGSLHGLAQIPGFSSRRALIISGENLYARRRGILAIIHRAIVSEPHMLWQFVLKPAEEEPLDLLKDMIGAIQSHPSHWIDRFASVASWKRIASRRIFVLLNPTRSYSPSWVESAETLLEDHCY